MSLYTNVNLMIKLYFVFRYITVNRNIDDRQMKNAYGENNKLHS
jgi:hypothetical protein